MWGTHKVGESEKQNYTKRFSSTYAGSWGYNRKRFDKPDRAGTRIVTDYELKIFSKALGVSMEWLTDESGTL